jgi:hypothetical protein
LDLTFLESIFSNKKKEERRKKKEERSLRWGIPKITKLLLNTTNPTQSFFNN